MADKRSIDALIAKLNGKVYTSVDELAADISHGLSAVSRNPSTERGLKNDIMTDVQGGTTLGVGDPGATNISDTLVQNPQPGIATDVGSGLKTRRQARIETRTRTLPATVVTAAEAGDTTVRVRVSAEGVSKSTDTLTGTETVGEIDMTQGTEYDAAMTGQPIVIAGGNGIQPIEAGRTVNVVMSENWEVTTTFMTRDRKNIPTVTRVLKSTSVALVNGFANNGAICVVYQSFPDDLLFTNLNYPDGNDWVFTDVFDSSYAGRPWGAFVIGTDTPSGTLDMSVTPALYYDYGVVGPAGEVSFTGIPWSYAFSNNRFSEVNGDPMATVYQFFFAIGCNQGQSVDFGNAGISYSWTDPSLHTSWTITDSNFPIPL